MLVEQGQDLFCLETGRGRTQQHQTATTSLFKFWSVRVNGDVPPALVGTSGPPPQSLEERSRTLQWWLCRRGSGGWRWQGGRGKGGLPVAVPLGIVPASARALLG